MVLNRNTGHVSPQYHVKFDSSFQTVRQDQLECTWQQSTFFVVTPLKHTNKRIQGKGTHLSEGAHKIPRLQSMNRSSNNVQSDPLQQQQQLNEVPQQVNDGTLSEQPNAGTLMTSQQSPQPHIGQREEDRPPQTNPRTQSEDLRHSKRASRPPQ